MKLVRQVSFLLIWLVVPLLASFIYPFIRQHETVINGLTTGIMINTLFFSIVIHEVSHGFAGYLCGDTTAMDAGRLTLNPVTHVSITGSILVPLVLWFMESSVMLGWAKPVPFSPINLRHYPRDQAFLSLAGPFSNFALAYIAFSLFLVMGFLFKLIYPDAGINLQWQLFETVSFGGIFLEGFWVMLFETLKYAVLVNIGLGVFNLIPFPPLDGFWVLRSLLPRRMAAALNKIQPFGFIFLLAALHFNLLQVIFYPIIGIFGLLQLFSAYCLR